MTHPYLNKILLLAALLSGCALYDDAPPYVEAEQDTIDMRPDLPVTPIDDMPDDAACTPRACVSGQCGMQDNGCGVQVSCGSALTMCPQGACGMIPDGCGGMLDCGACKCVGGQPTTSRCGTCELGLLRCEDDTPVCDDIPLPDGVQIPCDSILYVNSEGSGADGIGTRNSPFISLNAAISAAQQSGKQLVLIAGEGQRAEPIVLSDGVHVVAGFAPGSFARNPALRPHYKIPAGAGDVFGVTARSIVQPTILSGLDITTADATGPSATNYGVYASASPGLTLHNLIVKAGRGGPGKDGAAGAKGADGGRGEDGHVGRDLESIQRAGVELAMFPQKGKGGLNSSCPSVNGGNGGAGHGYDYYEDVDGEGYTVMIPTSQEPGKPSASGSGGGASGQDVSGSRNGQDAPYASSTTSQATRGDGGSPDGEIVGGVWQAKGKGGRGQQGAHGIGGGGGGGAFICRYNQTPSNDACPNANNWNYGGPGGGGGGAGGCGGGGGEGGEPGGASFGLFAINSALLRVIDSSLNASSGGVGGRGGASGDGGAGGSGGSGGNKSTRVVSDPATQTYRGSIDSVIRRGGSGASGRNGLKGGFGGGGAGGVSYGAYCSGGQLKVEGTVAFAAGGAAPGGTSDGMPSGQAGLSVDEFQCR